MKLEAFGRTLSLDRVKEQVQQVAMEAAVALTRAKVWVSTYVFGLTDDPTRSWKSLHELRNIYLKGGYIAEGIDLFPTYALGGGYTLESDDEAAKDEVQAFLDRIDFYDIAWNQMIDACVVRDGIAEIVNGNGELALTPVKIVCRPAECFEIITDETGKIIRYEQRYDNLGRSINPVISLLPDNVLHYQYLSRPDMPYGISLVERVLDDIKRDTRVTEAVTNGICLHGTPKWHVKINSNRPDAPPLSDTEWEAAQKQYQNINSLDQILSEGDVVIEAKDTAGVQNVQQYSDVTLSRVCSGMGVPGELLGLRQGTTDATAVSRIGAFLKKIKIVQRDVESQWNTQIIDKVTAKPGLVKLVLNDANPEDFVQIAAAITQLRTGQNPEKVAPWQWCRERLKIPTNDELGIEDTPDPEPQQPFGGLPFGQQQGPQGFIPKQSDAVTAAEKEMAAAARELAKAVKGAKN